MFLPGTLHQAFTVICIEKRSKDVSSRALFLDCHLYEQRGNQVHTLHSPATALLRSSPRLQGCLTDETRQRCRAAGISKPTSLLFISWCDLTFPALCICLRPTVQWQGFYVFSWYICETMSRLLKREHWFTFLLPSLSQIRPQGCKSWFERKCTIHAGIITIK